MVIKKGDVIKVQYEGTFEDGGVFDSTELNGGIPLKIEVGACQVIPGFENSVIGKEVGEEYNVKIEPVDAYGPIGLDLIQALPREQFPTTEEPELGKNVVLQNPQGLQRMATITKVDENEITLDLNHPLAGKTLNFKIKVLETGLEPDPAEACGCGCSCGSDQGDPKQGCC